MEKDDFKRSLHEVLDERNRIDEQRHRQEHDFIRSLIKDKERRQEMIDKIKTQVLGWGVVSLLGAIGTAVYHIFFKTK